VLIEALEATVIFDESVEMLLEITTELALAMMSLERELDESRELRDEATRVDEKIALEDASSLEEASEILYEADVELDGESETGKSADLEYVEGLGGTIELVEASMLESEAGLEETAELDKDV
jgi:hypothetical protein